MTRFAGTVLDATNEAVLDAPIWHALTTRQSDLAIGNTHVRRFAPEYGPLAATRDDGAEAMDALQEMVARHGDPVLFCQGAFACPSGLKVTRSKEIIQFILDDLSKPSGVLAPDQLGESDAAEMLALATMTEPGPFCSATHRLGAFRGIKRDGRLVAMAGERMRPPGFTEISAVCTHPDYRGLGYAGVVTHAAARQIVAKGEVPFLQCFADNLAGLALYHSLGFRERRRFTVTALTRA